VFRDVVADGLDQALGGVMRDLTTSFAPAAHHRWRKLFVVLQV
jgi:hypothetical protein